MAGIVFPDLAGSLGTGLQLNALMKRNARQDEEYEREREAGQYVGAALGGDKGAISKLATLSPKHAMAIAPLLDRLDQNQRNKLKEAAEFTTQSALGILNAPREQKAAAWNAAVTEAKTRGFDTSQWPTTYTPAAEGWLRYQVGRAEPITEYFKRQGDTPTAMGPAPGGAPPTATPASGDVLARTKAAIAGIESGAQSYAALGPVTNGDRAYGKYQVMGANIPQWTQAALGRPMTPQEFLLGPEAQEAVADHKLGQYIGKYGPEGAARAWFAGEGGMNNQGAKDVLGTSVAGYADRFNKGFGGPPVAGAPQQPQTAQASPAGGPPIPQGDMNAPGMPGPPQDQLAPFRAMQLPPGARFVGIKGVPVVKDGNTLIEMPDGTRTWAPLPQRKEPTTGGGPFAGNSMEAQDSNILLNGDPSSPAYALAYARMSQPRTSFDPNTGRPIVIQPMDMSSIRKPISAGGSLPTPQAPPNAAQTVAIPGGGTATMLEPLQKGASQKEQADLRTAKVEAEQIVTALEDFRKEFKNATFGDRAKSVAGMTTGLNTSYNVAALLAKGETLFNLGVLNGPDLDIIRRTLPDPSILRNIGASTKDVDAAIDKVIGILNTKIAAKEKQLGAAGGQPAAAKQGTYLGPDGSPISWNEIEATAKNRGITTDEVINKLGLKPADGR